MNTAFVEHCARCIIDDINNAPTGVIVADKYLTGKKFQKTVFGKLLVGDADAIGFHLQFRLDENWQDQIFNFVKEALNEEN